MQLLFGYRNILFDPGSWQSSTRSRSLYNGLPVSLPTGYGGGSLFTLYISVNLHIGQSKNHVDSEIKFSGVLYYLILFLKTLFKDSVHKTRFLVGIFLMSIFTTDSICWLFSN